MGTIPKDFDLRTRLDDYSKRLDRLDRNYRATRTIQGDAQVNYPGWKTEVYTDLATFAVPQGFTKYELIFESMSGFTVTKDPAFAASQGFIETAPYIWFQFGDGSTTAYLFDKNRNGLANYYTPNSCACRAVCPTNRSEAVPLENSDHTPAWYYTLGVWTWPVTSSSADTAGQIDVHISAEISFLV